MPKSRKQVSRKVSRRKVRVSRRKAKVSRRKARVMPIKYPRRPRSSVFYVDDMGRFEHRKVVQKPKIPEDIPWVHNMSAMLHKGKAQKYVPLIFGGHSVL